MRVPRGYAKHHRKKRYMKEAKGYWGGRSKLYRTAVESVLRSRKWAYIHRKQRRRNVRTLWIMRLNAAARSRGLPYRHLVEGLRRAGIVLDRKVLADLAVAEPAAFDAVVAEAKTALKGRPVSGSRRPAAVPH